MIVNGIDIVGYNWVKFVKSDQVHHIVNDDDIILYGTNSRDFSYLFEIVSNVAICDSEYIDLMNEGPSRIGSILVESNSVDTVMLDLILTDSEKTKVLASRYSVIILYNPIDGPLDFGWISKTVKVLKFKELYPQSQEHPIGNIRNARITKDHPFQGEFYDYSIRQLNNAFYTNMNYTRALNRLNYEIAKRMPEFNMIVGKVDRVNEKADTIYVDYSELTVEHKKFFRELRRNIAHTLPVTYEFRVTDDVKYHRYSYEMSNYDFITNICRLTVNDDTGEPWTFSIHWEVEPMSVDLKDPHNGNDTVGRSIKCTANIHLFTSIDKYVGSLVKRIEANYDKDTSVITDDYVIAG